MKKSFTNCLSLTLPLALTLASALAFNVGEQVELEAFLNARSDARFTKASNNIAATLSKGTRGEVMETKKMPSGNFGIKMKVEGGAHRGESFWVYYNLKTPLIKLLDAKNKELNKDQNKVDENDAVETAKKVELTADQKAYRAPEEKAVIDAATTALKLLDNKALLQIIANPKSLDCAPVVSALSVVPEDQYKETDVVQPYHEVATSPLHSSICQTSDSGWEQCKSADTGKIEGFKLFNNGPNKIVKNNEYFINREMSFEFSDLARSDMKLVISDSPDDTTSHATYSIMMFFPRTVMPAVKRVGDEFEVTLPNKEIVRYNAKTREVIGGVFTEGAMAQGDNKKAKPAAINYTGNGVMIRADKSGDLPYGDVETKSGAKAPSTTTATISKKGFKDCKIPSKDIWYTDYNKGGNVFVKSELTNDIGMDDFVKKKCGFSLY
ncbi:MAG: hypothetical protein PHY93_01440 [Bacteriovorax sp.]|nr:hypothetical protein [Bacteriovorax sp.]